MAVPQIAVVATLAVAVLVVQGRVIEIRVRRDRQGQRPGAVLEADLVGIDAGRPDVGEHVTAGQLAAGRGQRLAGLARDGHVEHRDLAFGGDARMHEIEVGHQGGIGRHLQPTRRCLSLVCADQDRRTDQREGQRRSEALHGSLPARPRVASRRIPKPQ
jgi:hypothetical protein